MAAMTTEPSCTVVVAPSMVISTERSRFTESVEKIVFDLRQFDAVLRPPRPGEGRNHIAKIELDFVGVGRLGRVGGEEQALFLGVCLHQRDQIRGPVGHAQIVERLVVDGEESDGRAVFGRHVRDGGAIGQAERSDAGAVELDELRDDALLAEHLRHGEDQVGCGGSARQFALQMEADDIGQQHGNGLAEHACLGLDAADAPAHHAQSVNHGGVRIGAHQRVGICERDRMAAIGEHHLRQIFEVYLVNNAGVRRHHAEIAERLLAPLEKRVPFAVPLELEQRVHRKSIVRTEAVHLHGMIDHQIDRDERVGAFRIGMEHAESIAHGGEIHHAGDAGKILQQHARWLKADFPWSGAERPLGHVIDVGVLYGEVVLVAQEVLEKHADGVRDARDIHAPALVQRLQPVDPVLLPSGPQRRSRPKAVDGLHRSVFIVGV